MSSFIHLDSEREDGGIVINVEKINAFYYRPEVEQTIIYVGGGAAECGFVVNGNKTKEICEAISVLGFASCFKAKNDEQKADE